MKAIHVLKTWPEPFEAVVRGDKTHEARKDDRGFKVGDTLHLTEWSPERESHTGRFCNVRVTYVTPGGAFGLPPDLCVMSIVREGSS